MSEIQNHLDRYRNTYFIYAGFVIVSYLSSMSFTSVYQIGYVVLIAVFIITFLKLTLSLVFGKNYVLIKAFSVRDLLYISIAVTFFVLYTFFFFPSKMPMKSFFAEDFIVIVFLVPILEEFYYRYGLFGFKYYLLVKKFELPIFWVMISNSLIFALMHTQNMSAVEGLYKFLQILPLSILLSLLRLKNFLYCIFAHVLFNFLITVFGI